MLSDNDPVSDKPVPRGLRLAFAIAISSVVAGIGGAIVGFVLSRSQEPRIVPVVASVQSTLLSGASSSQLLLTALESGESGKPVVEEGRSVQITLTFESEDGRHCRAFGSRETGAAAEGVACRNGTQWQIVAWDGTADLNEEFRAAGSSELIEDVMDRLGGSPVLEAAQERALIDRHWEAELPQ
jgi:hypothetical protein